ncbi:ABC transporter permease subunit [Bacillus sp. CMF12]|uniref:ABC transporter permease n=1 Tax=Bacillaceae TaxID=186817 RepID=UPI001FB1B4D7|nr:MULTISPECIES: ABC transporter permease subunit [Bacillaceae]UOE53069.1 ABC transporter permease subunit [Cytobacillus oceanisediminis]USK52276.1 ABC transporter permease subunit [Bacillus sp. CMF12]
MNPELLYSMTKYELRLLLRSRWLLNFMILFFFLAGLLYLYGLQSVKSEPAEVSYGLEGVNDNIETMGVNPEYYGLKEIKPEERHTAGFSQSAYNRSIAMLMNLSLWMLPIICMILGGSSIIADKENGRLSLYRTYHSSSAYYLISKFLSLVLSLFFVIGLSYGLFGFFFSLSGSSFAAHIYQVFLLVNMLLILVFSAASLLIGAISKSRMQGLSAAIIFWIIMVFVYEFIIFSVTGWIPYSLKQISLFSLILLNPVESVRVWSISKLNSEYLFGPEYLMIEKWGTNGSLTLALTLSIILIILITIISSARLLTKRGV